MGNEVKGIFLKTVNQYAVKLIQGKLYDGSKTMPIGSGIYFTSVNIHNPWKNEITYHVKIALSGANGVQGNYTDWSKFVLNYDKSTEFDDLGFQLILGASYSQFNEGYFVIECESQLDVVAVYTGAGEKDGQLSTMYMERVPCRSVLPGKY